MGKKSMSPLPISASPVASATNQQVSFKLPYKWLCLGLCGVLLTSFLVILTKWRPSTYTSLEDLLVSPAEFTGACQKTDANDYAEAFADFAAVPVALGKVLEFGCSTVGVTDSLLALQQRYVDEVSVALLPCDADCTRAQQGAIELQDNFFGSTSKYRYEPCLSGIGKWTCV
jgi:hypothetical protein